MSQGAPADAAPTTRGWRMHLMAAAEAGDGAQPGSLHLVAAEFPPGHPYHGRPLSPPVIIDIEPED